MAKIQELRDLVQLKEKEKEEAIKREKQERKEKFQVINQMNTELFDLDQQAGKNERLVRLCINGELGTYEKPAQTFVLAERVTEFNLQDELKKPNKPKQEVKDDAESSSDSSNEESTDDDDDDDGSESTFTVVKIEYKGTYTKSSAIVKEVGDAMLSDTRVYRSHYFHFQCTQVRTVIICLLF